MSVIPLQRFPRPDLAWIAVTGADRVRFLHALMTGDVAGLSPGEGNRNLLLTDKGKLTASCLLLVEEEQVLLGSAREAREGLLAALDHYLVTDDVAFESLALESHHLLGEGAPPWPRPPEGALQHLREGELRIVRHDLGPVPGWLLLTGAELPAPVAALPEGEPEVFEALRIAAGEPAWGAELSAGVFPQEVGLEDCLHALKGCYLGQETMVRIRTQGHVNWQLVGLSLQGGLAAAGDVLVAPGEPGKKIGEITSAAYLPGTEQPVALARLRHEHALPGTALTVNEAAKALGGETYTHEVAATVVALPFAY